MPVRQECISWLWAAAIALSLCSSLPADSTVRVAVKNSTEGFEATISGSTPAFVGFLRSEKGRNAEFRNVPPGRYLLRVELECGASLERVIAVEGTASQESLTKIELNARDAHIPGDWKGGQHVVSAKQLGRSRETDRALQKAWVHMERSETAQARAALRKALKAEPECSDAWTNLGLVAEWEGHVEEAERFHRQALRLAPESFACHINLSEVLEKLGEVSESLEFGRRAAAIRPKDLGVNLHLGTILVHAGRFEEAIRYLETARTLQPDSLGNAQIALAVAYIETRRYSMGLKELEEWLANNPHHPQHPLLTAVRSELESAMQAGDLPIVGQESTRDVPDSVPAGDGPPSR